MALFGGKTALITGGGRGIGKEIALMLARNGADVAVAARTKKELEKTAKEIERLGRESLVIKTDLAKDKDIKKMYSGFMKKFGKLDMLFNNAGVLFSGEFAKSSLRQADMMIDVNFRGTVRSTHEALKHMKNGGIIINTASVAGLNAYPTLAVYSATKFAVVGFTQAVAQEAQEKGIRVYSVCPGATKTKMFDKVYPGQNAEYTPGEVAEEVLEMIRSKTLKPGSAVVVKHHKKQKK
ncbi:SDR family NAD(P)-dependent oxidoreductase [Candidatus Micrarchaeota archaeon]|nr:SDR family NAD(P)-dependent oxidoreductase [Candidatus Micrarchaeota archaeon]MBD3418347.1 SDR family NAD(P)-dependent oxidoreductase [Candidatus Micrarchaeota archaeon]